MEQGSVGEGFRRVSCTLLRFSRRRVDEVPREARRGRMLCWGGQRGKRGLRVWSARVEEDLYSEAFGRSAGEVSAGSVGWEVKVYEGLTS